MKGFVRAKFIKAGLASDKVHLNPNVLTSDPGPSGGEGRYALFACRLSPEKRIGMLLAAWNDLGSELPLKVLGEGPEADQVAEAAVRHPNIEWLGWRPMEEVLALIGGAKFVVAPSSCYESFDRSLLAGFAKGTPVVASRLGSMHAFVDHRRTGVLFTPSDPADLVRQVRWLLSSADSYASMRLVARKEFEAYSTDKVNHDRLVRIYHAAREHMQQWSACPLRQGAAAQAPVGLFSDTSLELVARNIADGAPSDRLVLRQGFFPQTFAGLEDRKWRFVLLDADLYAPIRAGLEIFWPALVPGGVILVHDYLSTYYKGVRHGVDEFFDPLGVVPLPWPDRVGSAVVVKQPALADRGL